MALSEPTLVPRIHGKNKKKKKSTFSSRFLPSTDVKYYPGTEYLPLNLLSILLSNRDKRNTERLAVGNREKNHTRIAAQPVVTPSSQAALMDFEKFTIKITPPSTYTIKVCIIIGKKKKTFSVVKVSDNRYATVIKRPF